MDKLQNLIQQLENNIRHHEKANTAVSQSTVGWQLDHCFLVINGVVAELQKSNPGEYRWKFNWIRTLIFLRNKIPRGKVRSPKSVRPIEAATIEELTSKLALAQKNMAVLKTLPHNSYFTHPFFGQLNLKATIWFLKLHTKHHLKIVEDILNKG